VPALRPVAMPEDDTVETAVGDDDQAMLRPEIGVPLMSFGTALTCVSSPMLIVGEFRLRVMECTAGFGATTLTTALADLPSELAVIVTLPPVSAVTSPVGLMLAMPASDET
jgi:hypothetical protein